MGYEKTRRGGRLEPPLERHLLEFEQAIWGWLVTNHYKTAGDKVRLRMRREGLLPSSGAGQLPDSYRTWATCQRLNVLWWDGGLANQPYVLMVEFEVCEMVQHRFASYLKNVNQILSGGK